MRLSFTARRSCAVHGESRCKRPGYISGGFFAFHRRIFEYLADDPRLVLENEPLSQLTEAGELSAFRHGGFWHPMDNSRDYKHLNDLWDSEIAPWKTWDQVARPRLRAVA